MKVATAGSVVKANFKGLTDAQGYRYVNKARAGWRYAFVAYSSDGTRTYGEVKADMEGRAYDIIDGYRCQTLEDILERKRKWRRPKDLKDIAVIEEWLKR